MKDFLKSVYQLMPSIGFYKLFRKFYTPKFYKYLTTKGSFSTKLENGKSIRLKIDHSLYIEKEIFWNGIPCEFEPYTLRIWAELASNSNVIFDIGANTGIFTIIAKAYSNNAGIHAFEPVQYNAGILEKNIKLNTFTDIKLNKVAVSNENGEAKMFVSDTEVNYVNSVHINRSNNQALKEVKVPLITLQSYIKEQKINTLDLIKMDIEGHELEALEGLGEYLEQFRPIILIEVLNDEMASQLNIKFKDLNYLFFLIDDENESMVEKPKITTNGRLNYLLKPKN